MTLDFNRYAIEGNAFLRELDILLDLNDRNRTARVFRSVLHAFRDMLSLEENLQVMAQLPMFLKAVYAENWTMRLQPPKPKRIAELVVRVRELDGCTGDRDFGSDEEAELMICAVFLLLQRYVSEGEVRHILHQMPRELREFLSHNLLMI